MLEIKGFIKTGEEISLTCCENLQDILIDNKSLFEILSEKFNLDNEKFFDGEGESTVLGVSYLILDEAPDKNIKFDELSAQVIFSMLYGEYVSGCYSEYTCGFGSFDYFIGKKDGIDEGHSIFKELASYIDKYVWINIKSIRSMKIDKILKKIEE